MARKVVAGNWKMNTFVSEGVELTNKIKKAVLPDDVDVILAAPYTHLYALQREVISYPVFLAAQNCHTHDKGAYTGEISPMVLKDLGVTHVIIGHSERRAYFGESYEFLKDKMIAALKVGISPIFCCGEPLEVREAGKHQELVEEQIRSSLFELEDKQMKNCIVAYEPVWAIGTGVTATPDQAQEMHAYIRSLITGRYGLEMAQNTSILYGGSVKPGNANELFSQPDVDGGLVGGASLKADDFLAIINAY